MDIRLAPTGVERRSEIPIKLQVVSNLEQVIVLRCETCSYALLMFFDWRDAGMTDYVAIVKKCEGDIVYTVEGNTSTTVNGNSVRGVWQHQYPIGSGRILGYGMLS